MKCTIPDFIESESNRDASFSKGNYIGSDEFEEKVKDEYGIEKISRKQGRPRKEQLREPSPLAPKNNKVACTGIGAEPVEIGHNACSKMVQVNVPDETTEGESLQANL